MELLELQTKRTSSGGLNVTSSSLNLSSSVRTMETVRENDFEAVAGVSDSSLLSAIVHRKQERGSEGGLQETSLIERR